jgi:hypothetical protein
MNARILLPLGGLFLVACAPAFPSRPELPPVAAAASAVGGAAAFDRPAPVIPKPDLSKVNAEIRAATSRSVRR